MMRFMNVKLDMKNTGSSSYSVKGKTYKEVFDALSKRKHQGLYTWNTGVSYKMDGDKNIIDIKLSHTSDIEMPKWPGYSSAPKEDKAKWDNMFHTLLCHEQKHHTLAAKTLKAWAKTLTAAKQMDKKTFDAWHGKESKAHTAAQVAFDKKTKHGTDDASCRP
ncbi:MAG: putative secreted Zn-dependent protease [Neolewinella sp.]|jgi:predicted secreted Zn-dependent protease